MTPKRTVMPSGNVTSPILIVGEAPGKEEETQGFGFVGPSGEILWHFLLKYAGYRREDVRVANVVPVRYTDDKGETRAPTDEEIEAWRPILTAEITVNAYTTVLAIGAVATRFFLGPDADLHTLHGTKQRIFGFGGGGRVLDVVPIYHPAAGMRQTDLIPLTACDIAGFDSAPMLFGSSSVSGVGGDLEMDFDLVDLEERFERVREIAVDTEGYIGDRWSVQVTPVRGGSELLMAFVFLPEDALKLGWLAGWITRNRPTVRLHNALHDLPILREFGIDLIRLKIPFVDSMIHAYLICTEPKGLKELARRHLGFNMTSYQDMMRPWLDEARRDFLVPLCDGGAELSPPTAKRLKAVARDLGKGKPVDLGSRWEHWPDEVKAEIAFVAGRQFPGEDRMPDVVPAPVWQEYAALDPVATACIGPLLTQKVIDTGQMAVSTMDHAVVPMFERMQETGLLVDQSKVKALGLELDETLLKLEWEIKHRVGDIDFNPNSADDVAEFLYVDKGIRAPRMTKSRKRGATDAKTLKAIVQCHPVIPFVLQYREAFKLKTAFVNPLLGFVKSDGRIHPNVRLTNTTSGRPSMSDPNLLAFPTRTKLGKMVRGCFVASPGTKLVSVDFSQIELRVAADESQEPVMMDAFERGLDLHTITADNLKIPRDPTAKTTNFAVLYLCSPKALYVQLVAAGADVPADEAEGIEFCRGVIGGWWSLYNGLVEYREAVFAETRRNGFVRDRWGRIRYLQGITLKGHRWPFSYIREESERQALNHKIQAGAQGLMKTAMVAAWNFPAWGMSARNSPFRPLLQVYDELVFEVPEGEASAFAGGLKTVLLEAVQPLFKVKLGAKYSIGSDWGQLK
jgi:uracil-DNA glycosylase family 4